MRRGRRLVRLMLAILLSVAAAGTLLATGAADALDGPAGSDAFARLASCVGNSNHLLVMLLVDESGSLKQTDPSAQRVAAARVALSGLQSLGASSGVAVDVHLAGFSVDYRPVGTWTRLTEGSLPGLERDLNDFANRKSGIDTDYFVALRGAQRDFASRTNELSQNAVAAPCKALLWFTDGRYDIEDRTAATKAQGLTKDYAPDLRLDAKGAGAQLVARGRNLLCDGGNGLVDGLRTDDVELFTIPLATQISPTDLAFLRSISNGTDAGTICGQLGNGGSGITLDAKNIGDLLGAFDRTASEIGRGVRQPGADQTAVCAASPCPEGRLTFDIDETVRRFHILSRTGSDAVRVIVDGPAGARSVTLEPGRSGTTDMGGAHLRWSWATGQAVTIDAEHTGTGPGWDGTWALTFVDPSGTARGTATHSQIYLFGDLVPTLVAPQELLAGAVNRFDIGLASERDGRVLTAAPDARLDVTVTDPAGGGEQSLVVTPGPGGHFVATYPVADNVSASEATVTVRLTVRSRSGVAMSPVSRSVKLPVRIAGLPTLRLEHNRLAAIGSSRTTNATVIVQADPQTAGCVWLADSETRGPGSAGTFKADPDPAARDAGSCLRIAPGETRRLTVAVKASGTANGTASGTLRFAMTSDTQKEPRFLTLTYQAPMTRPIDTGKRIGVFLALLLPGLLLPLLIAYLAAWWSAQFQPLRVARSARLSLLVSPSRVERVDEDGNSTGSFALGFDDFDAALPTMGPFRHLEHRGHTLTARAPRSPFGSPYGEVSLPGTFAAGSALRCTSSDGRRGRIGLALPRQWILTMPEGPAGTGEEDAPRRAEILVFVEGTASVEDLQRISADIERQAPAAAEVLSSKAAAWWTAQQENVSPSEVGPSVGQSGDGSPFDGPPFGGPPPADDRPPFDDAPPFDSGPPFGTPSPAKPAASSKSRFGGRRPGRGTRRDVAPPTPAAMPGGSARNDDAPPWDD